MNTVVNKNSNEFSNFITKYKKLAIVNILMIVGISCSYYLCVASFKLAGGVTKHETYALFFGIGLVLMVMSFVRWLLFNIRWAASRMEKKL